MRRESHPTWEPLQADILCQHLHMAILVQPVADVSPSAHLHSQPDAFKHVGSELQVLVTLLGWTSGSNLYQGKSNGIMKILSVAPSVTLFLTCDYSCTYADICSASIFPLSNLLVFFSMGQTSAFALRRLKWEHSGCDLCKDSLARCNNFYLNSSKYINYLK